MNNGFMGGEKATKTFYRTFRRERKIAWELKLQCVQQHVVEGVVFWGLKSVYRAVMKLGKRRNEATLRDVHVLCCLGTRICEFHSGWCAMLEI